MSGQGFPFGSAQGFGVASAHKFMGGDEFLGLLAGGEWDDLQDGTEAKGFASWDGTEWKGWEGGLYATVDAFAIFDDELYFGGTFLTALGATENYLAKFDGSSFTSVGAPNDRVRALLVWNSNLYAAGDFTSIGAVSANRIAKYDGSAWTAMGTGLDAAGHALAEHDSDLYVGGAFTDADGVTIADGIAAWDGSNFSALGSFTSLNHVKTLISFGGNLVAGGNFQATGSVADLAEWDGASWARIGADDPNGDVYALAVYDSDLYVGGAFTNLDGAKSYIAMWDGAAWNAVGSGTGNNVTALYYDSTDDVLVVGGRFTTAGGSTANRIARWNGSAWSTYAPGFESTGGAQETHAIIRFE